MSKNLILEFIQKSSSKCITIDCLGDALIDEYYDVKVTRISPEFPMPIMHSINNYRKRKPGGVANVAHQLKHFNVCTTLYCLPDSSTAGVFSSKGLHEKAFEFYPQGRDGLFIQAQLPVKKRFLDGNTQIIRHDIELPLCGLTQEELDDCLELIQKSIVTPDVAIFSDYNKGFFSSKINLLESYKDCITIVDPKKGPLDKWKGCTIFKPNANEAKELSGKDNWQDQAYYFAINLGCESVVITHGGGHVAGISKGELFEYKPDKKVEAESVIGAGDCFCAFFAMAVGHGFKVPQAVEIAWNAGAVYVQRKMNKPVCGSELVEGIVDPTVLVNRNYKLVFVNGCFDVLHEGHISLLNFAKSKGDKLVVALNSDESVKRLKGDKRPLVPLAQRMSIMSQIKGVDYVVSFGEDTPEDVLNLIKPDVLVKGDQYQLSEIVGRDIVSEVYRAPMIPNVSTTKIIGDYLQGQV